MRSESLSVIHCKATCMVFMERGATFQRNNIIDSTLKIMSTFMYRLLPFYKKKYLILTETSQSKLPYYGPCLQLGP